MRVYISGPMTGHPGYNRPLFDWVEDYLRKTGYEVINPAKLQDMLLPEETTYEEYISVDLFLLDMCDAIFMLPDWETSQGARAEHKRAVEMKMQIIEGIWSSDPYEEDKYGVL